MIASTDGAPSRPEDRLLDLIIETAPDAIITIDQQGAILSFSPAAERMFGYDEAEVVGRNVSCLMPEPYRSQHDGYLARYLKTGEKRIIGIGREVRALRKDGEVFVAELAVGELSVESGPVFTGFIRDVTDRIEAIREANRLQRALDRVARIEMLGEMSTALAHEINQPLTAVANFARAARRNLQAEAPDLDKVFAQLDRIAEQAQRAGEILRRMRRMVDRGHADLRAEDLNDIVREAVRIGQTEAPYEGVTLVLDLADGLPGVLADRVQIQQVIVNLLRNAQEAILGEAAPADGARSRSLGTAAGAIRLRTRHRQTGEVEVTVADTGPGLPAPVVRTMFEPFSTTKASGLGVGLAVSRSLIQAHGGRIRAGNTAEGGAEVRFTLPVAERS